MSTPADYLTSPPVASGRYVALRSRAARASLSPAASTAELEGSDAKSMTPCAGSSGSGSGYAITFTTSHSPTVTLQTPTDARPCFTYS